MNDQVPDAALPSWVIVTQVKSNRIVYFTDDPQYAPAMDGDWYYCGQHLGALPPGLTLRNCWSWRFNGGVFTAAPPAARPSTQQSLLDNNRQALLALLQEKIDTVRAPFLPACRSGDEVRRLKLQQAQAFLTQAGEGAGDDDAARSTTFPLLQAVAVARHCSLQEAARLILAKDEETRRMLRETEAFREQLSMAIQAAGSAATLLELREWLLERVYPALSAGFRFRIDNTEPIDPDQPLPERHRRHEIARLKARLREVVNAQRAALHSDYLHNEDVRRHKARLAHGVLAHGGQPPPGLDCSLLQAYAQARGLDLATAARMVVESLAAGAALLQQTEIAKDRLLAQIDRICTLADIGAVDDALAALAALEARS